MAYRVLIVDDSPAMRAFVRRVMEISGFDLAACLEAANGVQALEVLVLRLRSLFTPIFSTNEEITAVIREQIS